MNLSQKLVYILYKILIPVNIINIINTYIKKWKKY